MFLNANFYTWSYRVAEWTWEEELAQQVADAIMDTSGGEAASISETAAEIGGLAAGSVLEALMLAPLALALDLDEQAPSTPDETGDAHAAPAAAAAAAIDAPVKAQKSAAAKSSPPMTEPLVPVTVPVAHVSTLPDAVALAEAQRGRWVLKGYRTEIAYSVHTDPNKVDLAFQANEQSGAEIDNKARARRPVDMGAGPAPASSRVEGSRPWHDRGPEPE